MNINLRPFSKSDSIEVIFDIHDNALRSIDCVPLDRKWNDDLNDIHHHYIAAGGEFIIVEIDSKIIGFGALRKLKPYLFEIKRMRIDQNFQRKGIGSILLRHLIQLAKEKGARNIILDTTIQQIGAQKLYEKFGFVRSGTTVIHGFDVLQYELHLNVQEGHVPN